MTRRAVFLDRDGVINRAIVRNGRPHPPDSISGLEILPEVPEALGRLAARGLDLIVVTNQPDVARGSQTREQVEAMHALLSESLPLTRIVACYHDDADACTCRKPAPGMLLEAAREGGIDLARSYMVGDRWRDVDAGLRAGCTTIWIDRGYEERQPVGYAARVTSLSEAVDWIEARE
ncbi:MAG TPA: HAD family hydrolase [Thermoanaerobaculia bacterium]|nr:HAD family hydrolase [Thermoanaerobaculia bacterium]